MIKLTAIRKSKKIAAGVLFFYSLLYLCMIFHFHPVTITNEDYLSFGAPSAVSLQQKNLHCEICHINSSFSQIPILTADDFNSVVINKVVPTNQEFPFLKYSGLSKQLRAPPLV